jgi:uncharacterized protein (TIGR02246 family)
MRTFPRIALAIVLSLAVVEVRAQASNAADEKDIRAISVQLQDAWNKADPKMLADLFLTDGDYISSTGRTARGRDEVEKAFAQQWAGIYKKTKIAVNVTNTRFVRRDVAIVDGTFEVSGMKNPAGKALPARSGLSSIVAVKKGDRWYMAALRGMVPSAPEGLGK